MLVGIVLPAKHPDESFPAGIQFLELDQGEAILSATTTASRLADGVDVSSEFLAGSADIQGDTVLHRIYGGEPGARYRVHMVITTSGSNIYRHWFDVPMIPMAL
jgi:hypothetical protein